MLSKPQILKIACLFVGAGLKHFDILALYYPDTRQDVEDWKMFFKKLAEGAPKLASLKLDTIYATRFKDVLIMPPSYYFNFGQIPQLITLTIYSDLMIFTNDDLQIVSSSLPLLRRLDICVHKKHVTTEGGLCHLQNLKMLEHLVLSFQEGRPDDPEVTEKESVTDLLEFCLLRMPKLKISGYDVAEEFFSFSTDCHSFSIFEQMGETVELGLEHLRLENDIPPAKVILPHVTHLDVSDMKALNFCLGHVFPKLRWLLVSRVSFKDLEKLLLHLGLPVTKLRLVFIDNLCDLLVILSHCPQLEDLSFDYTYLKNMNFINPSVSKLLVKMKKFCLEPVYIEELEGNEYCKAPGLLKLLMTSSPDLECLMLQVSISQTEINEVAAGITAGAYLCIPKLECVSLRINPEIAIAKESMENFVEQAVAHCPKLDNISVNGDIRADMLNPLRAMMRKFDRGNVLHNIYKKD